MSDCFKIYDINLVDQATLTASTENALFPVENIVDPRRSKVFRSTTNSDNIVLDFKETSEINGIFLVPDKREGFGFATVVVEFNSVDVWTSPPYSVTMTFSDAVSLGHSSFTSVFYRFARVVMTSTLGYCEVSKIFIGKEIPLTATINFGWTVKDEELSVKTKNRYGQIFTDVISRQKALNFAFKNITKDDLDQLNTLIDRVGETKPFYISLGNSLMAVDYRRFSGPVLLEDIPTVSNPLFNRFALSMSVKELT